MIRPATLAVLRFIDGYGKPMPIRSTAYPGLRNAIADGLVRAVPNTHARNRGRAAPFVFALTTRGREMLAEARLLAEIQRLGGVEVHRDQWPEAERLEAAGLINLGGARGPQGDWRRATPFVKED